MQRPAMLFVGTLYKDKDKYTIAKALLVESFGEISFETNIMPWDFSEHYIEELGQPISRRFIFFKNTVLIESLPDIKNKTRQMENELSAGGKRTINLDPGYLTEAKVVLASKKDYSHRIYLRDGICAEVTLTYKTKKGFMPNLYTYRDYASEEYINIFNKAREIYRKMLS